MLGHNKKIGRWGETLAREFLVKNGYQILFNNWQTKMGEIDLIALLGQDIVFIEVKTRTTPYCGWAETAVNATKKKKIGLLIDRFLLENEEYQKYFPRFDILVVELIKLNPDYIHYENVIIN